jgi:hypothetical protein
MLEEALSFHWLSDAVCCLQVVQELPLVNVTDSPITASATLSGKGYYGPRDVTVAAKGSGVYLLTFTPPGSGTYTGEVLGELFQITRVFYHHKLSGR